MIHEGGLARSLVFWFASRFSPNFPALRVFLLWYVWDDDGSGIYGGGRANTLRNITEIQR